MKRTLGIFAALVAVLICCYGYLLYQNNREVKPVSRERITQVYERSVGWLLSHRQQILRNNNTALWSMLEQSARITGDERVQKLYDKFLKDLDADYPYSVWQAYFHPREFHDAVFRPTDYQSLVDYQQYFLYGLTCSQQMAKVPLVEAQNNPDFCWSGFRMIRPACVTHQLMAYLMLQHNNCGVEHLKSKIAVLQRTIKKQLTYDPRVVDVYIQRVLMLAESGERTQIKTRWLERVLDAQLGDGGWSDMQPLIPLGGGRYFGFGAKGVKIGKLKSNFHATAQGVLLTSLLLHPQRLDGSR